MEGPTTKRDFREKKKSGEVSPLGVSGGPPPKTFCMIFAHFQTKRDIQNPSVCVCVGGGGQHRGWGEGGFGPSSIYILKKALP